MGPTEGAAGGVSGCPPEFALCLKPSEANKVRKMIESLKSYAADAWNLCGRSAGNATAP